MNKLLLSLFFIIVLTSFNTQIFYVEPTGTYKFNGIYKKKDDDVYGYSGEIQVKKINSEKIIMSFEVNKGAPSYNSGSFIDTLIYKENRVIWRNGQN
jgi:hypothetical protein